MLESPVTTDAVQVDASGSVVMASDAVPFRRRLFSQMASSKVAEWTKLIAITGSAQVAVQAIGFICGILVIRLLPVEEYALYTIANTMLGTMTLLADGGIASGVMSQGGKVWQDKKKLGAVLATGLSLRRQFAVYSLLVSIPILYYLLIKQGASWLTATMIVVSILPAFFSALSGALLEISVKLHQQIAPLQAIQVTSNALRLLLSGLTLFAFPFAGIAIAASGAAQIFNNWRLRAISAKLADSRAEEDPAARDKILGIVKRVLPGAIYYSISGQLSVWLITVFGRAESVAQVGALGRLALIFSIVNSILTALIVPRFARLAQVSEVILVRFFQVQALGLTFSGIILLFAWVAPAEILSILGGNYKELRGEVLLLALGSCASFMSGLNVSLLSSRGMNPPWFVFPLLGVTHTILFASIFDVSTVRGNLLLTLALSSCGYAYSIVTFLLLLKMIPARRHN